MATKKLTDAFLQKVKPPAAGRRQFLDMKQEGLCFRVTHNGAKSWSHLYRFDGQWRRDTLGSYPAIGLKAARQLVDEARGLVEVGIDPRERAKAREQAEAERQADTVEVVANRFLKLYADQRKTPETRQIMEHDIIPAWRTRPVSEITRKDAVALLDNIAERAPVQANRALKVMKLFFGWAVDREIVTGSPVATLKRPTREKPRQRWLDDDELRAFWKACDVLGWPFGRIAQLLAITACRRDEIAEMRWPELVGLDGAEPHLAVPPERYKTEKTFILPLPKTAVAIIAELPRVGTQSGLVFTTTDRTPVSGYSQAKRRLDALMLAELKRMATEMGKEPAKVTLPHWTLHDLRRTARTNMSKLGINADIAEACLGHMQRGIRRTYDQWEFLPEKRAALARWAAHLEGLVNPPEGDEKVVKLQRK